MPTKAYQINIELLDVKPKVWRRVIIPHNMLLSDLHNVLQTAMGWTNSHLHQFVHGKSILEPDLEDYDLESYGTIYTGMTINNFLKEKNDKIMYEYDFGDGWRHKITLENILHSYIGITPVCTDGAKNCPPEDVGGPWGFKDFKKAIADPSHPEHASYLEWVGEDYNPDDFDKDFVNELLQQDDFGTK